MGADPFFMFRTIYGADGEHRTPYLTQICLGRLRLHIFHRGDADPDAHDHPWDFWTFPLTAYVEEVAIRSLDDRPYDPWEPHRASYRLVRQVVPAFRWSFRPAEHTHRVLGRYDGGAFVIGALPGPPQVRPGKIVTLVWRGSNRRRWGFLKHRDGHWCWMHWKEYAFGGGKHAPCEPAFGPGRGA